MAYSDRSVGLEAELPHWVQSRFAVRVPALIAFTYACVVVVYLLELPRWLMLFGIPPYLLAAIATFYELRENGRSGWWILLMLANINLGPTWLGLSVGALINLVPVVIALHARQTRLAE
jgi:hypothetical protein